MAVLGLCRCTGFSLTAVPGGFSSSRSQASDRGGFSWCYPRALGCVGFSSCGPGL